MNRESIVEIKPEDGEYPCALLGKNPPTLYAVGDISLLQRRMLAVVGSRRTPLTALKIGEEICKTLSRELVILTGVADGGDSAAIEGALSGGGKPVCLLAGGFSALPQGNLRLLERVMKEGLLLAFHPFDTSVRNFSYEKRNELLASLSEGVFVLGAGEKSGALITAKYAAAQGKRIFALPYPPNSVVGCGCNGLIKKGANLVENAEDIAKAMGISLTEKKQEISLTDEENRVYALLCEQSEGHINELAQGAGVPAYKIRAILSALEVKGCVLALGGNRYTSIRK